MLARGHRMTEFARARIRQIRAFRCSSSNWDLLMEPLRERRKRLFRPPLSRHLNLIKTYLTLIMPYVMKTLILFSLISIWWYKIMIIRNTLQLMSVKLSKVIFSKISPKSLYHYLNIFVYKIFPNNIFPYNRKRNNLSWKNMKWKIESVE